MSYKKKATKKQKQGIDHLFREHKVIPKCVAIERDLDDIMLSRDVKLAEEGMRGYRA